MGAVYREELSANARKLIEQLLSLPQGWVTAAALAESIGVSRRTVLRELPAVEPVSYTHLTLPTNREV